MSDLIERLRFNADVLDHGGFHSGLAMTIREAADALEAAREDAARYRWLRDEARTNRVPHIFQYPPQPFDRPQYPHFKDVGLDAAIDAARKEARNG